VTTQESVFSSCSMLRGEPGSSVSIVSGYGLEDGRSRFDPRQRQKDFSSSLCVQTGSGAHHASCTMGTGGPFPRAKARLEVENE
jgi:hypothetical protein